MQKNNFSKVIIGLPYFNEGGKNSPAPNFKCTTAHSWIVDIENRTHSN